MISAIANAFSSTAFLTVVQNTAARVGIETTLKSVGRPAFILADKDIDAETKKYAATKEFAYQAICLGVYLALIPPIFKRGSFWLGKKAFGATHPEFSKFKGIDEYLDYHRLATKVKNDRLQSLNKIKSNTKFMHDGLREDLINKENPETYDLIKGTIEAGTFIGSVLGLSILAPQISHYLVHPFMRAFGLAPAKEKKVKEPKIDKTV